MHAIFGSLRHTSPAWEGALLILRVLYNTWTSQRNKLIRDDEDFLERELLAFDSYTGCPWVEVAVVVVVLVMEWWRSVNVMEDYLEFGLNFKFQWDEGAKTLPTYRRQAREEEERRTEAQVEQLTARPAYPRRRTSSTPRHTTDRRRHLTRSTFRESGWVKVPFSWSSRTRRLTPPPPPPLLP